MMILTARPDGQLVEDSDQSIDSTHKKIGDGCSWSRPTPNMDGDFDVDNPDAYEEDEDELASDDSPWFPDLDQSDECFEGVFDEELALKFKGGES